MANVLSIVNKEIKAYIQSPVLYFSAFFFLLISGSWFYFVINNIATAEPGMETTFKMMVSLLLLLCPVLTMHLFADERRSGTIELLMTYPLKDWEVVVGKYISSLILFIAIVLCTLEFPLFILIFGEAEIGPMFTGYFGFILLGASFLAVGVLGSAMSKSQMLASVISFSIVLGLMIFGLAANMVGPGPLAHVLEYLPGTAHYENFAAGLIDTRDLIFFASFIFFSLFTAIRVVEINRWK